MVPIHLDRINARTLLRLCNYAMTQRTPQQNKAFRKYATMLAEQLNDAGYTLTRCVEEDLLKYEVSWNQENVLDIMARPVMLALYPLKAWRDPDRPSTAELSTTEISQVYEELNRFTGLKFGVSMDFPSEESR